MRNRNIQNTNKNNYISNNCEKYGSKIDSLDRQFKGLQSSESVDP
jgi:hypothetical protein